MCVVVYYGVVVYLCFNTVLASKMALLIYTRFKLFIKNFLPSYRGKSPDKRGY